MIIQLIVEIKRLVNYDETIYYENGYSLRFQLIFQIAFFLLMGISYFPLIFLGKRTRFFKFFLLIACVFDIAYCVLLFTIPLSTNDEQTEIDFTKKILEDLHGLDAGIMMMKENNTNLYEKAEVKVYTSDSGIFQLTLKCLSPLFMMLVIFFPVCMYFFIV